MAGNRYSRRRFLVDSGGAFGAAWVAANYPALAIAVEDAGNVVAGNADVSLVFLSAEQAGLVDAISARLMPGDTNDPGAREAHVTIFLDRVLAGVFSRNADGFISGLSRFDADFADHYGSSFVEAGETEQDAFLITQSKTGFFGQINLFTHMGMFALPSYGGNFDKTGWQLLGFEDRHVFQPPFGYYDRDYPGFEVVAARYKGKT
jgi:gluconate 2-dehydrogenase gamma chain